MPTFLVNVNVADIVKGCYIPALENVTIGLDEDVEVNNHTLAQAFIKQHPKLFRRICKNLYMHSIRENMLAVLVRWSVNLCDHKLNCHCNGVSKKKDKVKKK